MKALALACALLFVGANVANAQFAGSGHDFSDGVIHYQADDPLYDSGEGTAWNAGGEDMCTVCHNAHTPGIGTPLWFHKMSSATYTVYDSPTFDGSVANGGDISSPDGSSVLCLSCHDGTVGVNQYGWASFFAADDPTYTVPHPTGADLSADHPISFTYDGTLATADGFLADPDVESVTLTAFNTTTQTGSLTDVILFDGKMQCASCHDVHNKYNIEHGLNITKTGDLICTTCHKK